MSTQTDLLMTAASWPNSLNVLLTVVILHGTKDYMQHIVDIYLLLTEANLHYNPGNV